MEAAEEPAGVDGGASAEREALDVIELDLVDGAADPAALERPGAAPVVALPNGAPDRGGNVTGPFTGRRSRSGRFPRLSLLPRLLHDSAALRVTLEDEVEPDLEDLVLGRPRVGVRQRGAGGRELVEEAAGDGDVDAAKVCGERLDLDALRARAGGW
ncbi:MAG TPA: hypothetical protein VF875_02190 [Anaeromyxobacter sp.]